MTLPFFTPPDEASISTVACSDRTFSAWRLMDSTNSFCVAVCSGALEYCCSTVRVRKRQPVVGNIVMSNVSFQKGQARLMLIYSMISSSFEYSGLERFQNKRLARGVGTLLTNVPARTDGRHSFQII